MRPGNLVYKINVLLSLSAVALVAYLALVRLQPYCPVLLSERTLKLEVPGLISKESSAMLKGAYAFDEKIFKKRQLFSQSVTKKAEEKKIEFILLGVSVGDKNLAMLRDVTAKQDYYCVAGDRIGVFKVKEIFKDKVILESEGKMLEIRQ